MHRCYVSFRHMYSIGRERERERSRLERNVGVFQTEYSTNVIVQFSFWARPFSSKVPRDFEEQRRRNQFIQINAEQIDPNLLQRAYNLHNTICEILLASYESLQDFYETMIEHLPTGEEKPGHGKSFLCQFFPFTLLLLLQSIKNVDKNFEIFVIN